VSDERKPEDPIPVEERLSLLEAALDATNDGLIIISLDGRVIWYNRRYLHMFGFNDEDLLAGGLTYIVREAAAQMEDGDVKAARALQFLRNPVTEMLDVLRFKDGRVYERFAAPLKVNGRIAGLVSNYSDISRPVRSEAALEQHRAFLEKAQEVAHIGSWVAELDGSDRLGWSVETHRIFGVQTGRFPGTSKAFFQFVHPDDVEAIARAQAAAAETGDAYDIEHRIIRNDGEVRWVHQRADVVRDDRGVALRMVGTVQDITDRRQLEDQLRQSQKLEAIGRLAGGVAHDINNALTAIAGYTELALGVLEAGHPARSDVAEIRRGAERAASVTRQLLAFSRRQMREPRVFSLVKATEGVGRMLERMLGDNIEIRTELAAEVPHVYGDPGQIEQAIVNLAINARDAMPDGGRLLLGLASTEIAPGVTRSGVRLPAGVYAELRVADTGHGMSPETQAHIFEPFFTTKEVGKGTGLGLSMVYGTVKQSAGFIFVESQEGRGTTFRLLFPAAEAADKPADTSARRDEAGATPAGDQATVLVVEDEAAVRNLAVTALANEGYRILQAGSAEAAHELLDTTDVHIDLLLTDANMPGQSGPDLAGALARERPDLLVVVMSGYTDEVLQVSGLSQPVALLPKPFTPRELRQKVRDVLRSRRRQS
jgi:two-component system, cell cycle sensor histidine kinase and response regulator CckA